MTLEEQLIDRYTKRIDALKKKRDSHSLQISHLDSEIDHLNVKIGALRKPEVGKASASPMPEAIFVGGGGASQDCVTPTVVHGDTGIVSAGGWTVRADETPGILETNG